MRAESVVRSREAAVWSPKAGAPFQVASACFVIRCVDEVVVFSSFSSRVNRADRGEELTVL